MNIKKYLSTIGKCGGSVRSESKAAAAKRNGAKGGRPKKYRPGVCVVCDFNRSTNLDFRKIPKREQMPHVKPCPLGLIQSLK